MYLNTSHQDYPSSIADWPAHQRLAMFIDLNHALRQTRSIDSERWKQVFFCLCERVRASEMYIVKDDKSGGLYVKLIAEPMYRFAVSSRGHCRIMAKPGQQFISQIGDGSYRLTVIRSARRPR